MHIIIIVLDLIFSSVNVMTPSEIKGNSVLGYYIFFNHYRARVNQPNAKERIIVNVITRNGYFLALITFNANGPTAV